MIWYDLLMSNAAATVRENWTQSLNKDFKKEDINHGTSPS